MIPDATYSQIAVPPRLLERAADVSTTPADLEGNFGRRKAFTTGTGRLAMQRYASRYSSDTGTDNRLVPGLRGAYG